VDAEENDDENEDRNNLLISQPKYSQLLKELDFSHSRMVNEKLDFSFSLRFLSGWCNESSVW
jgi:hypothetical protein